MNIPVITELFKKKQSTKIWAINRGYKRLKSENRLELPRQLIDVLSKTKLDNTSRLKSFFHRDNFDIELSIRQFLTCRILESSFIKSFLYSIGSNKSLTHPLPKEWRDALIYQGIKVNNFKCTLYWHILGFLMWAKHVLSELKNIYFLLNKQPDLGKYIYFYELNDSNISVNSKRHNIVNWYLRWNNRNKEFNTICHSAGGKSFFELNKIGIVQTDGLPKLTRTQLLKYLGFYIYEVIFSLVWVFFKPTYGFLLKESIKLKRFDLANENDLARDYLFHSPNFYRPMWTYVAEEKGSRILYYQYSTNHADFKNKNGYPLEQPWYLWSWPHYLVWDEFHADFIRRHDKHNSVIENVGHIWFSSSGNCADIPLNSIAVFDVSPSKFAIYDNSSSYYNYNLVNQFLSDIHTVLNKNNIDMVHKAKRTKKFEYKRYIRRIRELSNELNYINIFSNVDALQVIQKTKACISIPFTSPAIIAKQEGKPSVYYDPSGLIQKDDIGAHDIPILSSLHELEEWIDHIKNSLNQ